MVEKGVGEGGGKVGGDEGGRGFAVAAYGSGCVTGCLCGFVVLWFVVFGGGGVNGL